MLINARLLHAVPALHTNIAWLLLLIQLVNDSPIWRLIERFALLKVMMIVIDAPREPISRAGALVVVVEIKRWFEWWLLLVVKLGV